MLQPSRHRSAVPWYRGGDPARSRGLTTLLFTAVILPLMFVMLTVTIEFAHFFGIRDELQRVLDRQAHDALVQGLGEEDVAHAVRQRMRNVSGMTQITNVRHFRAQARSIVEARAEYSGAFFQFVEGFTGRERTVLPISLQSQVRIQTAASLILVDRAVSAGSNSCSDPGLQAIAGFVDRLTESWVDVAGARVAVGVTPGVTPIAPGVVAPVELLAQDASDALPRCRAAVLGSSFDVAAIRGSIGTPFDAFDVGYALRELATPELLEQEREVRNVVLVLRRERYDAGFAQGIFTLLQDSARNLPIRVDMYAVVLDATGTIDHRPLNAGINGGVYRELGASASELNGSRLLGAMTQTITDRIVLEN